MVRSSTIRGSFVIFSLLSIALMFESVAYAATAEVTKSGSNFIVRVDGTQTYSGTNYSDAL